MARRSLLSTPILAVSARPHPPLTDVMQLPPVSGEAVVAKFDGGLS